MKIAIEFEDEDDSDLIQYTLVSGCGTVDELACTFTSIVAATNWDFDAVVASLLQYTSEGESPILYKACEEWWEKHQV